MNILQFSKQFFFIFLLSLLTANEISAQSVVGKWNQVTARQYLVDPGAGSSGKSYIETDISTIGRVVYEFRNDKTFIMTSTSRLDTADKRSSTGSWSQNGDVLTMSTLTGDHSITSTVTFQSDDLFLETLHPESKKTRKVVLIFKKMKQ